MAGVQQQWTFRLTLIRHGETDHNLNKIIQGQDNTVLNETGKEQVELVGNRFKYEYLTRIYSSDLERASKTAEGICLRNVYLKDLKICMETLLRERNYGEAEGKSHQELKKMLSFGRLPNGAETESQMHKRVVDFFTKLLRDVSHLRKLHHSTLETKDLSLWEQHTPMATQSKVDLGDELCKNSHSDPSSKLSKAALNDASLASQVEKQRAASFPVTHKKAQSPVLLKDLCHDLDGTSDNDHTDRPIHIMVVSHGGVLRHLVSYFSKNFPSHFPVDKKKLLRQICPNTGVSEFMVNLEGRKVTSIDCLKLYDKSHLHF